MSHPWLTLRPPRPSAKIRSRQASLVTTDQQQQLQTAQLNLTQFVERWLGHPTSPYAFSDSSADLVLSRAGSDASVGLCSPSRCASLTTPEVSSEEESSGDEEPLFRPDTARPKPVEHSRVSNIRREESLKRARGRLVQQASKEEHYISIDQVKTLKQQGSLDEMVAKVSSSPGSRRGSVTQAPSAARLRTADSPRPQTPSPLVTQAAGGAPQVDRQPSPTAQTTVCDRVMSEAADALSGGPLSRQRLSPTPVSASPRQPTPTPPAPAQLTSGTGDSASSVPPPSPRGLPRTPSPLLNTGGAPPTKSKSRSPQPGAETSLSVPARSRSRTPSVTVTDTADTPAADVNTSVGGSDPASSSTGATLKADSAKKPRKSKSKDSMSGDESAPRRRRSKSPSAGETSEGANAESPASGAASSKVKTPSGKTTPEPTPSKTGDSQPMKSSGEVKTSSGNTTPEPKTIKIRQESLVAKPSSEARTSSGKTTPEPKTIQIQQESLSTKPSTESRSSSGKSTPEPRTIKIQHEAQPEKINSMIFNLKPVKRTGPSPIATTLTTKAPSSLGLVTLKKVSSSKSEVSLTTKASESEMAQVRLRRTRPSDPLLTSQRERPVLTRQKADTGGTAVKKKPSTKHRPKHELDASRTNSAAEITPPPPSKNGRRPREHIIQVEVLGCAGPELEPAAPSGRPALRKLRQALRTLSSGSCQSAPSSPYPSREGSPERELRPAGLLLRSWHRDRLRAGGGWSGCGPTLLDFVSARLEEAAGCQRREQERFERLLKQRRPLSPPPVADRRSMRDPFSWARLGWSITD